MPDPTDPIDAPDPLDRLDRLAPAVDDSVAASGFRTVRRRRTRHRRIVTGGVAVLAVIAGAAIGLQFVDGDPVARQALYTGPLPHDPPGSVEQDGLRLTLEAPREATVGTRVPLTVSLTNTTDRPLRAATVQACDEQVTAGIQAEGAEGGIGLEHVPEGEEPTPDPDAGWLGLLPQAVRPAVEWDGRPGSLSATVGPQPTGDAWEGDDALGGAGNEGCLAMWTPPHEIGPGETVERRLVVDLRWGAEAPTGRYEAVALGGAVVDANGMPADGADVADDLELSVPIEITDDPARAATRSEALAALAATPTLPEWIAHTSDIDAVAGFHQRWAATMSWWDDGWETWIAPYAGNGHQVDPLRIRWDAERDEIVDVRTVFWGGTPSDDPAQPDPLPEPVDEIRYHAD